MGSNITKALSARTILVASLATAPFLIGCYNAKIRAPVRQQTGEGAKHVDTGVSLFWGATNTSSDAIECPAGIAYAEVYHPWWGYFLVSPLTLGIVTPIRKVWICADPSPSQGAQGGPQIILLQPGSVAPAAPVPKGKGGE